MADAAVLKTAEGNLVRVRLPSSAPTLQNDIPCLPWAARDCFLEDAHRAVLQPQTTTYFLAMSSRYLYAYCYTNML